MKISCTCPVTLKPDPMWALGGYFRFKIDNKESILTLFEPKCNFFKYLVQILSKYHYMVLDISDHTSMVIFWGFMALSRSKIDPKRVNFDAF